MKLFNPVATVFCAVFWLGGSVTAFGQNNADALDANLKLAQEMQQQAARSQARIDQLSSQTESLLQEYKRLTTDAEYQGQYESELIALQQQQEQQIQTLSQQLDAIQYTQQRLNPLLRTMVEALEQFVVLDLPFHHQQRLDSVIGLREKVFSGNLLLADKFRLLMEAYQAELAYGNSLESYRQQIQLNGQPITVQCLRIGRLALYFLTLDGTKAGVWDPQQRAWKSLPDAEVARLKQAAKVAGGRIAPELVSLPLAQQWTGE